MAQSVADSDFLVLLNERLPDNRLQVKCTACDETSARAAWLVHIRGKVHRKLVAIFRGPDKAYVQLHRDARQVAHIECKLCHARFKSGQPAHGRRIRLDHWSEHAADARHIAARVAAAAATPAAAAVPVAAVAN